MNEYKRQLFHAIFGVGIVILLIYKILTPFILFLALLVGIALSLICMKYRVPVIRWFLEQFEREGTHPGKGAICFLIGVLLAVKLFPEDVAYASIMILALGDSTAHFFGEKFGKIKHPLSKEKLLEGSLLGTLLGFLGAVIFVPPLQAVIAATIAMIAEAMEIEFNNQLIDDNISIPLVAGVTILLIRKFIGG